MQGHSFRSNLSGETPDDWRKYGYYRYWQHSPDRPGHFGIRGERYKLAFYYGNGLKKKDAKDDGGPAQYWDFFDLQKDPKELHNAYNDPEYQDIIGKMKEEILRQRTELGDTDESNEKIRKIISDHWDEQI
jgi:hypothetical protein